MRLYRKQQLVGIDVGNQTICVVECRAGEGRTIKVTAEAKVPTPPGSFDEGQVLDAKLLAEGIRAALKAAGTGARRAAVAVPAQFGFLRRVTFPKMPLKELRAAIDLAPERYIPFTRDGSVYDISVLPGETADGQQSVVVAAAPRQNVADLMAVCRLAGLKPARVDLEPLALYRAMVGAGLTTADACVAIVDLGASAAKISLFEGTVPVINRVVDMPHGTGDHSTEFFAGVATEDLFLDIRRSLEFALSQSGARPSRVFVGGGAGEDDYLMLSLTAYLRSYLAGRLPADFQVEPVRAPSLGLAQSQMLAFGLSLLPELFT